jgi:acetyltransferase-like isoleucine patch superfamily enzyme
MRLGAKFMHRIIYWFKCSQRTAEMVTTALNRALHYLLFRTIYYFKIGRKIWDKFRKQPIYTIGVFKAILMGLIYSLLYKIIRKNVNICFPLKAFAPLKIIGPGSVFIDKNCSVNYSVFKGLTIVTYQKDSCVIIGKNCNLEGLTIRCKKHIRIGNNVKTAVSLVQDTEFIHQDNFNSNDSLMCDGIIDIKDNSWISGNCIVLSGSTIGEDSVLAAGSLCYNINMPKFSIGAGSPFNKALGIAHVLKLMRSK